MFCRACADHAVLCLLVLLNPFVFQRSKTSQRLISHDIHSNTFNYKSTYSMEIVPICKVLNRPIRLLPLPPMRSSRVHKSSGFFSSSVRQAGRGKSPGLTAESSLSFRGGICYLSARSGIFCVICRVCVCEIRCFGLPQPRVLLLQRGYSSGIIVQVFFLCA